MITIGITGGVGCGKSKILEHIKENYNCKIILSDDVGNKVKEPGEACYESLIKNCEVIRRKYLETKNDHYFDILLKMLPASYKVVNLC